MKNFTCTGTEVQSSSAPEIDVDPTSVAFGEVTVGESATEEILVANDGDADLTVTVTKSGSGYFTFSPSSLTVTPAAYLGTITVTYSPGAVGSHSATLSLAHNDTSTDSPITVSLSGTGKAGEYEWDGPDSGWCLKGSAGGLDWNANTTAKKMITDADFGGGDYSRVTLNSLSGAVTYKWYGGGSFWIGKFGNDQATPAFNTVYVPGGGSWGGDFSSTFTSGKYYTFRGKFYTNPSNAGERMNDFVIMETTGAPTKFTGAGAGNPSGTAGTEAQTVSVTLNQTPNSEETVYVRYKAGSAAWATVALTSGSGTTRSGSIPAQTAGTVVEYYFLTTTVGKSTLDDNADLCTLNGLKNGANNWSYTATASAPTVGTPTRTGTTAVGATLGGTVSATGGATVTSWGVVYSASSLNSNPTVGGTGCTNVTAGGTPGLGAFTAAVSGLKANTEYKWKAYAVNSAGTGYTTVQTFTTPCMSAGPVVKPEPGNSSATFTWDDVGAGRYLLSLWTDGSVSSTMTHTFPTSGGAASDGESITDTTPDPDVTVGSLSFDKGSANTAPGYYAGGLRLYNSTGTYKGGSVTLTLATGVKLTKVVVTSSQTQPLEYVVDGGSAVDGAWNSGTMTITLATAATSSFKLHNVANASSGHIRIGRLELTYEKGGKKYVVGYGAEGGEVTSGVTVSGLTPGTTYNWSLKAVGGGTGCEQDATAAAGYNFTVTPTAADEAPVWKTIAAITRTLSLGTLTKDMTAELSKAGSPAPTFSVTMNTGSATPSGSYSVNENTGSFTFTPALADAGKTFTFKFTASNRAGSATQTMAVTVTGGTLTLTGNFNKFETAAGTASQPQSVTLAGSNLGALETVTVAVGAPFEVSVDGTSYGASKTVTTTVAGAIASGQLVYVRVAATASQGNNQTGTLQAYCTSAGGSGSAVTKSLTADVSGESTATAIERSYIVVNDGLGVEWFNGSGSGQTHSFSEYYLGEFTSLRLAGEASTRGDGSAAGHVVTMNYTVDTGTEGAWSTLTMPWKEWDDPLNKHQSHDGAGNLTYTPDLASGRAPGLYYIRVFFSQVTTSGTIYDSRNNLNYVASFRVPLTTPTISSVTSARVVSLSGKDAGATYVVVRKDSDSGWGTPTGELPSAGATWCGGTVVYVGTDSSFTDTTAAGCARYYYKAWTKSGSENVWSAGSASYYSPTMDTPAVPVLNALSDLTYQGFTASWNAVPGAVTYRMDIVKGGGSTTYTLVTGSRTVEDGEYLISDEGDARLMSAYGSSLYTAVTATFTSSAVTSAVTDSEIWVIKNHGTYYTIKNKDSGKYVSYTGSSNTAAETTDETAASAHWDLTLASGVLSANNKNSTDRYLQYNYNNGNPRFLGYKNTQDNLHLYKVSGGSTPVAGWTDKDVGSIMTTANGVVSVAVTGLEELTTYSVTVRAEGSTAACASADSNTQSATTLENDTVTSVGIANYDAAGESAGSNVADGSVAAGQTVLVQGTKLTVASGAVNPVLTGVTFTTTGTAGTDDLATFQVRVGTSATFAGTETVKGSVTAGAAGSHTVTFGSAQTLTAGQTYYVWIEAVTKAGAMGGNTVGVAALAKDAFAMTGARKNGSTVATGLQTIGNLTAFAAATGASAGGQVDLTWTAGAGGSVLVRWSDVSLAEIPAPGTAWADEETGLTGGSHTVSGVTGCKTYYFKAWEVIGGVACGTARTGTAAASAPAAPTGLGHGTPGAHNATLTWSAAAGAAGYAIDLWHYEGGGISGIDGTYEIVTSEDALEDGNYVIVAATASGLVAMSNTIHSTPYIELATVSDSTTDTTLDITTGDGAIVWKLAWDSVSGTWSIKNEAFNSWAGGYAASHGSANQATIEDALTTAGQWTAAVSSGLWTLTNVKESDRALKYNPQNPRFACYTGGQTALKLFKQMGGSGTKVDDVIGGVVQAGSAVTVAASGATGVTLGGLTEATGYGWKVTALGDGGCTGGTSGSDSFSTAELLGAPTVTAWTGPGAGQVTGTVTRAAGATVTLKRYASREDALADANGSVVATVATESATLVAFDDTGLAGCATHWYRAWQSATVEGTPTTSAGSEPASAAATLGAPAVSPAGAGTALTLSWTPVPGADYYTVLVSDTEGVWTSSSSDGSAVLEQDFAGFTSTTTADVGENLDSYTGLSGWYGGKVYPNSGSAKLGSGSATGFITTRRIAGGLANGGTVYFDLMDYGDGTTVSVQICLDDGDDDAENDEWTELKSVEPGSSWQTFQASLPSGNTDFWICFETTKKRVYIDNIRVVPTVPSGSGSGKVGLKYQTTVTEAPWSRTVDGLEVGETYWYMVTAWSDGGCTNATGGSAATADVPQLAAVPKRYDFRTLERDESAEKTFTLRNSGSRLNPATTPALEIASIAVVPSGIGYTVVSGGTAATLEPGQTHSVTVRFAPVTAGTKDAVLRVTCNAYNADPEGTVAAGKTFDIPLAGECHDPSTEPPTVFTVDVEDGLGIEDTIADHSLALGTPDGTGGELPGAKRPELKVVLWHYNGIWTNLTGAKAATWTLKDPEGTAVLSGQAFTGVVARTYGGKSCMEFSAAVPALGEEGAVRGAYTVEVSAWDATKTHEVPAAAAGTYTPAEKGWLLDDFTRADRKGDGLGALEEGWVAQSTDSTPGSAAIHGGALELWGPYGDRSGEDGRAAAVRDMSDWGYEKNPEDMASAVSWGFHFRMGGEPVNFTDGSTAGAFVLGAAGSGFFANDTAQKGYAVTMTGAGIELVRFSKGWIESGTRTVLVPRTKNGSGAWVEDGTKPHGWTGTFAGKTLAVRVDFLPGQEYIEDVQDEVPARMKLFVKDVASTGGNPLEECTDADLAATVHLAGGDLIGESLPYAGAVWNHGHDTTAGGSDKKWGLFDDFHFPCQKGQEIPSVVHVIDEDTEAPELEGFDIGGAVAAATAASAGLSFTGMVHDASGIWTGGAKAPGWTLTVDDTERASGTFASVGIVPSGDGAGTDVALSGSIPASAFDAAWRTTNCVVTVRAWDHDRDRAGDSLEGTAEFRFTLCDEAPVAPAWATAEADGAEMVVLRWARTAGKTYVVVRSDEEIAEDAAPQGRLEALAEGTTVEGWGKVVYNGTGDNHLAGTWTAREFVVAPGSSNYFAVYGMTGDGTTGHFFSTPVHPTAYHWTSSTTNAETGAVTVTDHTAVDGSGVPVAGAVEEGGWPCTTAKYEPGEGVDAFAYRTSVPEIGDTDPQNLALAFNYETRPETGSGWGGPWTGDTDKWKLHDASLPVGETRYPAPAANKLYWQDTSTGSRDEAKLTRALASPNGGTFFVAAILNYDEPHPETGAESKWIQIVLQDASGNDIVSFGKPGWDSINAAIEYDGGQYAGFDPFELYSGHGNDYIVVGQVDRNAGKFRMWAYYAGAGQIPEIFSKKVEGRDEEVSFDTLPTAMNSFVADCDFSGTPAPVAKIQLRAGSESGKELGHVYFDEVRFASTWEELFLFNAPEVESFDFDKPDAGSGIMVGEDADGHRLWKISDGALAHGDVGLNAQFELYHRTGIAAASFTIKDEEGNSLLRPAEWRATTTNAQTGAVTTNDTRAGTGGAPVAVHLDGARDSAYPEWWTTNAAGRIGGAVGVAVPTNWISTNATYTVEVKMTSIGGKEATVTAASETGGGGASDLFFGEYGEGRYWDKYIELYNGTGHDIDLYDYYIFRPANASSGGNDFSATYDNLIPNGTHPFARICPEENPSEHVILHHKETIVLLNNKMGASGDDLTIRNNRLAALKTALTQAGARYILMTNEVLDAGGKVPYLLVKAEDFDEATVTAAKGSSRVSLNWLDACGNSANIIDHGPSEDGKFIMSRKETATHLPRSKPYIIDESEWEYRDWCWPEPRLNDDYDTTPKYTNFVATAGQYDRNIGLGGNMEFTVYDDDEVAPVLGAEGNGLYLTKTGGVPDLLERAAGTRDFVLAGWSFTNTASAAAAMEVWSGSAEKENARLTCSANVGTVERLVSVGSGKGVTGVEFNGVNQVGNGELYFKCNTEGYNITAEDEAWIGFETDMESMTDREVSFWYATGSDGFKAGKVQVSTDGVSWEDVWELELDATTGTGGASTFAEFVGSLEYEKDGAPAIPRGVGHLWFRVVVSERKTGNGSFRMDCIQVRGTPDEVAVSDAALVGARPTFLARVSDPGSGLDEATAVFKSGLETVAGSGAAHTRSASLVDGGKDPASSLSWQVDEALTTDNVQKWFAASEEGGTHLKITVADADDDRAGDQTTLNADFGVLRVYDDDEDPPEIKMTSMKPRTGNTLAAWCFGDKPEATAAAATKHANGLNASVLKARAGGGAEPPKPLRPSAYDSADASKGWGVYQSGWHFGTKYWYVRLETLVGTTGDDGAVFKINKISFDSKTGSTNSPTACTVSLVSGITAASIDPDTDAPADGTETTLGSLSLLPSGASAWTADTIKTWKDGCSLAVDVTLDGNSLNELRIRGTGCADPSKGVGAPWYIHDLTVEGTVTYANGQTEDVTYVTDHALAGGASLGSLTGNAWDEKSGISEATYSLKRGGTTLVPTTALAFTGSMADAKSEAAGEFAVDLSGVAAGYNNVVLGDYTGSVEVWDADADRTSGGENVDRLKIDGDFGFTVVDQDVKGPTAPSGVAVNGVSMDSVTEPLWTNKPDFTITFAVAHDEAPTAEEMTANGWIDGVQDGVTGVGEYRVALADTDAGRAAASAYSVTVTNGAAGNGGFENATAEPWTCNVSGSGVQPTGVSKGGAKVTAKEGVNSFYLQAHTSANGYPEVAQILPLEVSGSDYTVDVDVTASVYKRGAGTIVYAQIQLAAATADFDGGDVMWTSPSGNQAGGGAYQFNTGSGASGDPVEEWLKDRALATKTITVPAGAAYMRFCLFANSAGANVDDVRLSVKKGAGTTGMMRYVATPEAQGLQNKFLYAVDADNDRRNDRLAGAAAAFHTAYDITAPTPVAFKSHGKGASTDQVDDPTTQFDLTWFSNDIGPDDPDDANYQPGWTGKEVLSPWGTYRVYYRTYDPVALEAEAADAGKNTETYLYETLIEGTDAQGRPKYHGAGWKHVENGAEIEDVTAPAVGGKRKYSGWDQITKDANNQQTVRLYDLDFDQEYVVVVVGVDKAGNEGPVNSSSWATNNTIKFSLTRGWHVPKADAVTALEGRVSDIGQRLTNAVVSALEWTAAGMTRNAETGEMEGETTKDYDLLQWDARNFRESPDNEWKLLQTVKTNWFVDDGGPTNRGSIRFYRASYKDRWKKAVTNATTGQVTAQTPLVSEEVYAQTAVRLRPGENYTALHGVPYTNTFHAVFGGAEEFPGGTTAALGTTIDFFTPATNALAHETYWLRDDGEWMDGGDRPVGDVVQTDRNFFTRAFSINLPNELPEKYVAGTETIRHSNGNTTLVPYMVWKPILQVPTNGFSQAIRCGEVTAPVFNVVALRLPVAAHPSEMNLVESGFGYVEGSQVFRGDQIYTIDTITREPGHSCYCKKVVEDGQVRYEWRFVGGNGLVPAGYFKPNDVLVIVSKSGGAGESWTWTYNPKKFYTLPNRHMQAGE